MRKRVIAQHGLKCYYCGRNLARDEVTMDHVIPWSCGGKTELENLVPCCEECNQEKGNRKDTA